MLFSLVDDDEMFCVFSRVLANVNFVKGPKNVALLVTCAYTENNAENEVKPALT